jgi:transcriptional regulator with XRE-family HTH domain
MAQYRYSKNHKDYQLLISIALVLKELRSSKGVSQLEVYNETNVHIGRIETCESNFNLSTLSVLLKYFDIRMSEFFLMVESRR